MRLGDSWKGNPSQYVVGKSSEDRRLSFGSSNLGRISGDSGFGRRCFVAEDSRTWEEQELLIFPSGPPKSQPVATEYLRNLGNDALAEVLLVIATHWPDDHIRGLAPSADFWCSAALSSQELSTLVAATETGVERSGGVQGSRSAILCSHFRYEITGNFEFRESCLA